MAAEAARGWGWTVPGATVTGPSINSQSAELMGSRMAKPSLSWFGHHRIARPAGSQSGTLAAT
ncbi:hypothetical protein, partial [Mesorhizobium japonicum]|uniref:hypothetical protein n=1 Tax=Mesorhizobium japonicum TaxID=2066070 RepID=UPI003B5B8720